MALTRTMRVKKMTNDLYIGKPMEKDISLLISTRQWKLYTASQISLTNWKLKTPLHKVLLPGQEASMDYNVDGTVIGFRVLNNDNNEIDYYRC